MDFLKSFFSSFSITIQNNSEQSIFFSISSPDHPPFLYAQRGSVLPGESRKFLLSKRQARVYCFIRKGDVGEDYLMLNLPNEFYKSGDTIVITDEHLSNIKESVSQAQFNPEYESI